jgi:hypothetical protein
MLNSFARICNWSPPNMHLTANSIRGHISRPAPGSSLAVVRKSLPQHRTTRIERLLLMATIIILALQGYFPQVPGFSIAFFMFIMSGVYVLFKRPGTLASISFDPLFVTAYILLSLGSLIEFFHPYASYSEIFRIGQMIAGAMIVASLCRDRSALRAAMYGYLIAGVWLSVYFFLTSYNVLSEATATDFYAASRLRAEALADSPFHANLAPLITANGAVVALASTLTTHAPYRRYLFLGIAVFCVIASTLPLSRGGIAIMIVSLVAVMFAGGVWRGRTILMAGVICAAIVMWVPDVVWSRLTFSTETRQGHMEVRARIYTAAVEHFPEYAMTGVGVGNFWGAWGRHSNYGARGGVIGAHNVFIQVTIYWGLAGLLALTAVVWQAYRCLPRHCGSDSLSLQLLGVSVAALIMALSIHNLYAKDFSLVLGLLVGARRWLWPKGIVPPAARKQRPPRPTLARMS